ncbi:MAG: hypothetical protein ACFE9S_02570 [Candidatus Hermodarchaeota archaeon]
MARREITAISIMIVSGFSILISIPIILISFGYSPHNDIGYRSPPIDEVFNTSKVVDLNLKIDIGDVDIHYTYSPVDYHMRINVVIDMIGQNIAEKDHTDYFSIEWEKINNSFTFSMELIPNSGYNDTFWIRHDVMIIVTLNPIILFNINSKINVEGDYNLQVLGGITVNNIDLYTEIGKIILEFSFCNIGGNISGKSGAGDLELNLINVEYSRNCAWNLTTYPGGLYISDILISITQNIAMGANITGTAITKLGDISLYYTDNTPYVGANFTFYRRAPQGPTEGFQYDNDVDTDKWWQVRHFYYSNDYPAIGNYNISCKTLMETYGGYDMDLKSE